MKNVRTHRDLLVWQGGMQLARLVYEVTAAFPREECFGLTAQMRRAAVSVVSNVAEGAGRVSTREFSRFLGIARGSLAELETQIIIAQHLMFLREDERLSHQINRTGQLLTALHRAIQAKAKER